jgi:hypothetical protein
MALAIFDNFLCRHIESHALLDAIEVRINDLKTAQVIHGMGTPARFLRNKTGSFSGTAGFFVLMIDCS